MVQNSSNAYQAYQNNQVNTASKGSLLLLLYDGLLKNLRLSVVSLEEKNNEKINLYLLKSQDIIEELMVTLNFDAGDIAKNLYTLYEYLKYELVQANIEKDINKVLNVQEMIRDLRDTWAKIA